MISSPLAVMAVLASVVTIGYLGINNYNIRNEGVTVANIAERNLGNLNLTLGDCSTKIGGVRTKVTNLEAQIKQLTDAKGKSDASLKAAQAEGAASLAKAAGEFNKLNAELDAADVKTANLTKKLTALGIKVSTVGGLFTGSTSSMSSTSTTKH